MIDAPAPTPSAHDYAIARLSRQRDTAEQLVDRLNAQIAALEADKAALADRLAEMTAEASAPAKANARKEQADG